MIHATRATVLISRFTVQGLTALLGVLALASTAAAAERPIHRWALLVGIARYQHAQELSFCGADQRALAAQLADNGFDAQRVFLLDDQAKDAKYLPFKANIEQRLDLLLKLVKEGDVLIVGFSCHGVLHKNTTYLCPTEGNLDDPATLISLDAVCNKLDRSPATLKLVLVDACRRNARPIGNRGPGDDPKALARALAQVQPPPGLLLLNSCSEGEVAKEDGDLKHGVFMHFVLEGLRGAADADHNRHVSLRELSDYAAEETELYVMRKFNDSQQPFLKCGLKANGQKFDLFAVASTGASKPVDRSDGEPKPGQTITSKTLGMKLALIPAGEFTMGSDESMAELEQAFGKLPDKFSKADEHPEHHVHITEPFYMGAYEVTKAQFAQFVEAEEYKTDAEKYGKGGWGWTEKESKFEQKPEYTWRSWGFEQPGDHPVVNVSWNDATAFCAWLSKQEGKEFRLPTEAESEYACRAGTNTRFYNGDDPEGLVKIGNVADGTAKEKFTWWSFTVKGKDGYAFTAPVGHFRANKFGLYDMTGNAWEWCSDWYDADYYANSPSDDPRGPAAAGSFRVIRGGGWHFNPVFCRSAYRNNAGPAYRDYFIGFRVVRAW